MTCNSIPVPSCYGSRFTIPPQIPLNRTDASGMDKEVDEPGVVASRMHEGNFGLRTYGFRDSWMASELQLIHIDSLRLCSEEDRLGFVFDTKLWTKAELVACIRYLSKDNTKVAAATLLNCWPIP